MKEEDCPGERQWKAHLAMLQNLKRENQLTAGDRTFVINTLM